MMRYESVRVDVLRELALAAASKPTDDNDGNDEN